MKSIKNTLNLKLTQKMIVSLAMQQALTALQLPILELAQWIDQQLNQNPLIKKESLDQEEFTSLDLENPTFEVLKHLDETFVEGVFPEENKDNYFREIEEVASTSLYQHLMQQAEAIFNDKQQLQHAEQIIGNLNSDGFLENTDVDPHILRIIQTFDPPGVAARSLQESLLIQLRFQKKQNSISFSLIQNYFSDLLKQNFSFLSCKLGISIEELHLILKNDISSLDFCPGKKFDRPTSPTIIPDIFIETLNGAFEVKINDINIPNFNVLPSDNASTHHYYHEGKWLKKILKTRENILHQITLALLNKHSSFFLGLSKEIAPFTMFELSQEIRLHPSTITRAVKDKYLSCPQGIFPLRHFFPRSSALSKTGAWVSHSQAKNILKQLIDQEDKARPFSDTDLVRKLREAGINCARRTISKYRHSLKIPTAYRRKIKGKFIKTLSDTPPSN